MSLPALFRLRATVLSVRFHLLCNSRKAVLQKWCTAMCTSMLDRSVREGDPVLALVGESSAASFVQDLKLALSLPRGALMSTLAFSMGSAGRAVCAISSLSTCRRRAS